ncbi:hypothetical protein BO70DRAFT_375932 [Aspergillus heteromorphus CBS 117.55]|uniref:Glutathione synthetase ATP-binding domain-like protein n=1 Tax=Aspergillus heteromorphus CBS 117.55 TaxID=1448321 RepID=A0A317X0P6_9EURO|nr:uncharacterized protein BO70DRAFT_375932 [Aspergillus heteromorphus CBS 117.55]PWY92176.1 hypothetical protein BO70DRAFT_375932 [Aspergillus heteromorphus CBS 117.55]
MTMVFDSNIQQICLASTSSPANPISPKAVQKDIQLQQRETFRSHFKSLTNGCLGNINNNSPNPLLVPDRFPRDVAKLHEALVIGLTDIVERWWTDEEAAFPCRMPLEPHEEELLYWVHEQTLEKNIRPFKECRGHWRTDLLLSTEWPRAVRICEINARYSINAQLLAAYGYEVYDAMAAERGCLRTGGDAKQFVEDQLNLFDPQYPLHIVNEQYRTPFTELFVSCAHQNTGSRPTIIKPSDLRLLKDPASRTGYSLYCQSTRDHPDLLTKDGEPLDRIHQTAIHLYQHELRLIPAEVLRHLALCGVNDMRSILLIHDKRILGLLLQELDSLVLKHRVLTAEQAEMLRQGIIPTINPGSLELEQLIEQTKKLAPIQDSYIIKPVRSGRGDGILLGQALSPTQWEALLGGLRDAKLVSGRTVYVVQPLVKQPVVEVVDHRGKVRASHLVGSCHLADGKVTGLGVWRAGGGSKYTMTVSFFYCSPLVII